MELRKNDNLKSAKNNNIKPAKSNNTKLNKPIIWSQQNLKKSE